MKKIKKLESEVQGLSHEELAEFRAWFSELDWKAWDLEPENDIHAGKLDSLGRSKGTARVIRSLFEASRDTSLLA